MSASISQMVATVANVVTGKKGEEQFTEASVGTTLLYSILFTLFILFLVSLGAARLSYCYSIYTGNSGGVAFMWSILAFFFSSIYYPFYALVLNPVCSLPAAPAAGAMMGGGSKKRK
jgi:hypothetical protein